MKAVFIIPYFGHLPEYFQLWMKAASRNADIDFWIYTDDVCAHSPYPNIQITQIDFKSFVAKVQQKFTFQVALDSPRKLCDFKPLYGYIFEKEIKNYRFWGYCDIDIVLGDLDKMIPWDDGYEKMFVHGHMTLFHNNHKMNRLFMNDVEGFCSYKKVFSTPKNVVFDEPSDDLNINLISQQEKIKVYYDYHIADINPYHFLFKRTMYDYSLPYKRGRIVKVEEVGKQLFLWEDGRLFRCYMLNGELQKEELRYFHFQKRMMRILPGTYESQRLIIVPNKVFPFEKPITPEIIDQFVRKAIIYPQYFILKWKNLKKKIVARKKD